MNFFHLVFQCILFTTGRNDDCSGDGEMDRRSLKNNSRTYNCFLCCEAAGSNSSEIFIFEHGQRLLHTQKTVMEVLSHILGRRLSNLEATTVLCYSCTTLVNEADSVMHRHEKIKQEARALFDNKKQLQQQHNRVPKQEQLPTNEYQITVMASPDEDDVPSNVEIEHQVSSHPSVGEDVEPDEKSIITYSKRGRKRKSIVFDNSVQSPMKLEPAEDSTVPTLECDVDIDDSAEEKRKRRRLFGGRGGRGRGRSRSRGRGKAVVRSTLIGRGLEGQYSTTNKRVRLVCKGSKLYNCNECKEEFKKYSDLVTHRKSHTVVDNTPLEVEETVLESGIITYFNKDKANSSDTSHSCKDCDKVFLRKDDLSYHYEISHTDGKGRTKSAFKDKYYPCPECPMNFLFKYKLNLHINNKHLNDGGDCANDFTCKECGSKLGSLPGLTFHMRKHHNKVMNAKKTTEYLCSDCGFLATSNKKLKEHQEALCGTITPNRQQVQCEICGKKVLKVSLKMHRIKMHSDFKEQCDRCGERYATKTDLLRHINVVHLNILLYSCKQCEEKFPTSDALRYHRVKVHEKASFTCNICNKSYKRVGELNTHIKRTHNGRAKGEKCDYCGKEYYDRSGLRNHLISKHAVPQELTYTSNYLRKKRVDGLPLAKHYEKQQAMESENKGAIVQHYIQGYEESTHPGNDVLQQQQLHHHSNPHHSQMLVAHHSQHSNTIVHQQQQQQPHGSHSTTHVLHHQQHHHTQQEEETVIAARTLQDSYSNNAATDSQQEDETSLVVTEITDDSSADPHHHHHHQQPQQQIIIDSLGNIINHSMIVPQHHHHHQAHHNTGNSEANTVATLHPQQHHSTAAVRADNNTVPQQQQHRVGVYPRLALY